MCPMMCRLMCWLLCAVYVSAQRFLMCPMIFRLLCWMCQRLNQLQKCFCILVWMWPFAPESNYYFYLFPKILYPINNILLSCSVNTTLIIAYDRFFDNFIFIRFYCFFNFRYTAVCYPYKYREMIQAQTTNSRVFKLIFPVFVFSVLLNISRFFETVIQYETFEEILDDNKTVIIESIGYDVTPLRKNPDYVR